MHVHVDQARAHHEPHRHLHDFRTIGLQVRAHFGDAIAFNQHVENPVAAIGRVDDPAPLEQAFHLELSI
jgi:hypothetical protein